MAPACRSGTKDGEERGGSRPRSAIATQRFDKCFSRTWSEAKASGKDDAGAPLPRNEDVADYAWKKCLEKIGGPEKAQELGIAAGPDEFQRKYGPFEGMADDERVMESTLPSPGEEK